MKSLVSSLKRFVSAALESIIPKRARITRIEKRTFGDIPVSPAIKEVDGIQITTLMDYRHFVVEDLIRSLKYDGSPRAAALCAEALEDFLREEIASLRAFSPQNVLLIPVPLHGSRKRERGFNQIDVILKHLPEEFRNGGLSAFAPHALSRIRATKQQTHLSRAERIENMINAFAVVNQTIVRDMHVFLIDDVTTTGATLVSAANRLKDAGATVTTIAIARA